MKPDEVQSSKVKMEQVLKQENFQPMRGAVRQAIAAVDNARMGKRLFFPTKWPRLNRQLLGGLQPGNLYIIAGRPGVGKSAFSNQMVFDVLDQAELLGHDIICLYWSFEMPGYKQILRDAAKDTKLQMTDLYSVDQTLGAASFKSFVESVTKKIPFPIYFMNKTRTVLRLRQLLQVLLFSMCLTIPDLFLTIKRKTR
jgi:replicative DNA helicase